MKENSGLFGFILIVTVISLACADYDELCARFADDVKLRQPGNCEAYVSCRNGTGTLNACSSGQLYDKENKKCVDTLSDDYCNDQCKGKNDIFISDQISCNGYYYCRSGDAIAGACPDGYHFDATDQICVFPSDSQCKGVPDFCGITPNSVPFVDPDNCNKYYQCTKGVLKQTTCKDGLYFDVSSAACITKYDVSCGTHPIPSNICGKDSKPTYDKFVADGATCRGYYFCAYKGNKISDKNPAWNQCAEGLFFEADTQSCKDPTLVSCKHNRCEGRGDLLVIAEDWGCRHYHVCQNGLTVDKLQCPRDMFFDEYRQACIYDEISYPTCDY